MLILKMRKINDINDKFNRFDGTELFKLNQELKIEIDSLRNFDFNLEEKIKKFNLTQNQIYWENMQLKNYSYS